MHRDPRETPHRHTPRGAPHRTPHTHTGSQPLTHRREPPHRHTTHPPGSPTRSHTGEPRELPHTQGPPHAHTGKPPHTTTPHTPGSPITDTHPWDPLTDLFTHIHTGNPLAPLSSPRQTRTGSRRPGTPLTGRPSHPHREPLRGSLTRPGAPLPTPPPPRRPTRTVLTFPICWPQTKCGEDEQKPPDDGEGPSSSARLHSSFFNWTKSPFPKKKKKKVQNCSLSFLSPSSKNNEGGKRQTRSGAG